MYLYTMNMQEKMQPGINMLQKEGHMIQKVAQGRFRDLQKELSHALVKTEYLMMKHPRRAAAIAAGAGAALAMVAMGSIMWGMKSKRGKAQCAHCR